MDPQPAQERPIRRIAVFCGSSNGASPVYAEGARRMGCLLASRGIGLVYGGGTVGLMGETARAVHEGGAEVFGCIPKALAPRELSGEMIGHLVVVDDMHQRKAEMARQADGFIGLPGGFGTLEELLEVITWQQLGFHNKPVGHSHISRELSQRSMALLSPADSAALHSAGSVQVVHAVIRQTIRLPTAWITWTQQSYTCAYSTHEQDIWWRGANMKSTMLCLHEFTAG
ncbi:hypothetical protein DUNSADRAFT_14457 [Dunaliella salina]|uniref:Cytokinin riboside 5'-monophosphate phosphoribohydrolase n=1 Tax=Dunaliella salina TaxID=3046 RepID=A0ABQ7H9L4_DUNSA|nr:hypothetical protein DUNSADRAFT_14457 [Dunaliella salina]|eukprot:KAF5843541.1 hypothetical protein DUNSADRAFT_14457 [Dunaliella salina]